MGMLMFDIVKRVDYTTLRKKTAIDINLLLPKTVFPSNFEILAKIGSHRLLTHRRGAHRKFFPSYLKNEFLLSCNYSCS